MKKTLALLLLAPSLSLYAQAHWVGTWSTAPLQTNNAGATTVLGTAPTVAPSPSVQPNAATPTPPSPATVPARPVAPAGNTGVIHPPNNDPGMARTLPNNDPKIAISPAVPQTIAVRPPALGSQDMTLSQTVHISIGGSAVRVVFTNEYGTEPLTIGAATVAFLTSPAHPQTPPVVPKPVDIAFGGKPSIIIPPGAIVISDPVKMQVDTFSDLLVDLFIPAQTITHLTRHTGALQTSFIAAGNFKTAETHTPIYSWTFLKSVDVLAPANTASIVAFGDSITDGAYATRDQNARWPDDLARRLAADPRTKNLGVLNEGIGGNRVLHDNTGPSALARFTRDALDQAGVKYIIILEAINDIGNAYRPTPAPRDVVTADDLIQGYQQLIERAHLKGVKVIIATLTPYNGASYNSPDGEKVRQAVNAWIRTNKSFDGMIDFDKATSDPTHPDTFLPAYDHGDHLHPTDAGLKAMADAIDLSLFTR